MRGIAIVLTEEWIERSCNSEWGLNPSFASTLRSHTFSLCLCCPICKVVSIWKCSFILMSVHIKHSHLYAMRIIQRTSFPTRYKWEVSSLRPFTTFQQNFKWPCSSCLYTLFWKCFVLLPFLVTRWFVVKTIFLFIRRNLSLVFRKVIFGLVLFISVFEKSSIW